MLKSFAKNSILYYTSTILTKGISFFLLPLYTSLISQEEYGISELVSLFTTLVIILFTLQIGQGVARYYNELRNQRQTQIYSSTVAAFSILSFVIFVLIAFLFLGHLADYLGLTKGETIVAVFSIALNGLFYLSQNQLQWKIKPVQEMIASITYSITTIGLTLYFLVYLNMGIVGIFAAQCGGAFGGIAVGYLFTRADYGAYFSWRVLKLLFQFSLPLLPGALSIFVYGFMDRICIKEMLPIEALGVYSVGNKIASILVFTGIGVSAAISPLIYRYYKHDETPFKLALLFRIFSTLSFIVLAFLAFFSRDILRIMTTGDYEAATTVIPFLLFAIYMNSMTLFFPGLAIQKKTGLISLIAVIAGVINLCLNLLLIPEFGILAAAAVTCLSFGINFILLYFYSQKEYPIPVSLLPQAIVSLVFFALLFVLYYYQYGLWMQVLGFIVCSALVLFLVLKKTDFVYIRERLNSFLESKTRPEKEIK